jgi:hypothetical protein
MKIVERLRNLQWKEIICAAAILLIIYMTSMCVQKGSKILNFTDEVQATEVILKELIDHTVVYLKTSGALIVIRTRYYGGFLVLRGERLRTVVKFTNDCLRCIDLENCPPVNVDFLLRLAISSPVILEVKNFTQCETFMRCQWFDYEFNCHDLVYIAELFDSLPEPFVV